MKGPFTYLVLSLSLGASQCACLAVVVPLKPGNAVEDANADHTDDLQRAINESSAVHIPAGVYRIDPSKGLIVRTGTRIFGDGKDATVLLCKEGPGSVFKRAPLNSGKNPYVVNVEIRDLAIVFTHNGSYDQIGFDFRHITRSSIHGCYAGNFSRGGLRPVRRDNEGGTPGGYFKGYGIVLGNMSSGASSYCGGEINNVA